jgi:DNA-binding transcriptional regulator/RsmH inhibitor MraZ
MGIESLNASGNTTTAMSSDPVRFFGKYFLKVAASTNQVTLPKQLKKAAEKGGEVHLVLFGYKKEKFWRMMTEKAFLQLVEDTANDTSRSNAKTAAGKLASMAQSVDLDTQNRFSLPKEFTEKLVETNEIVFEAMNTMVRLWPKPDFEEASRQEELDCEAAIEAALKRA